MSLGTLPAVGFVLITPLALLAVPIRLRVSAPRELTQVITPSETNKNCDIRHCLVGVLLPLPQFFFFGLLLHIMSPPPAAVAARIITTHKVGLSSIYPS